MFDCDFIDRCFGTTSNKDDKCYKENQTLTSGICYFKNATLDNNTKNEIIQHKLQDNLYDIIASTKIGENGIAVDDSLREIEVVIPLVLQGEILDIPTKEDFEKIKQALQHIKRMGLNRNRGLGRCKFIVEEQK